MRQVAGFLLVGLALLKAVGLIAVVSTGDGDRPTRWFVKQSVYAIAAASIGWPLLRKKRREDTGDDAYSPN
jgi:hypothetical protein